MTIQKEVSEFMFNKLPKGVDNSAMGKRFTMKIGENDFTIVPIFQGCASYHRLDDRAYKGSDHLVQD